MNHQWLITFRSVTFAQKALRLLQQLRIYATMQRTPRELSQRGCGYCLRLSENQVLQAVEILRQRGAEFGKVYAITHDGLEEREP